ncbi:hypothetical protein PUNSTDRAFT_134134 [Punctularia strigosozonata HHB-11173 SS5]|uniref:uncharacterized protein n=1 Tax=Punctularia strigosozonata (strain HHB-11173) TaxID=741275 RepID=UPI0004418036|nr:uncharacterized protein PUNSTDRAFT_134134 [Punctularia strigosozonata HHB-11173 SS5]EIN08961.1 hypothetical protein PUNSTDRAFT_134134 [Punctularia strigosozonata HHB-11173 SS5]
MSPPESLDPYARGRYEYTQKYRKAMRKLPRHMVTEDLEPGDCPLFYYGFGVPHDQLISYAIRKAFIPPGTTSIMACLPLIPHTLTMLCGARIHLGVTEHTVYTFVIALYTNFTLLDDKLSSFDEADVLQIVKRELKLEAEAEPLWYWDVSTPRDEILQMAKAPRKKKTPQKSLQGQENLAPNKPSDTQAVQPTLA